MIYDILEAKLTTLGLVAGESLFRNYIPADVKQGVMVRAPLAGIPINPDIPNWYRAEIQLVTRGVRMSEVEPLASRVQAVLTVSAVEIYPATLERGAAHLTAFYPKALPIPFPRLEGGGHETSQWFVAAFGFEPLSL